MIREILQSSLIVKPNEILSKMSRNYWFVNTWTNNANNCMTINFYLETIRTFYFFPCFRCFHYELPTWSSVFGLSESPSVRLEKSAKNYIAINNNIRCKINFEKVETKTYTRLLCNKHVTNMLQTKISDLFIVRR